MVFIYFCQMYDYLVVGLGLAGMAFCDHLEQEGKSFRVYDDGSLQASRVAGGLYNPVVLKRFNRAWGAGQQLPLVAPFYTRMEHKLGGRFHISLPVFRCFSSAEDQNLWFEAADTPTLKPYLSDKIHHNPNPALKADFGLGEVLGTGRVYTRELLEAYSGYLHDGGNLVKQAFDYGRLLVHKDHVSYDSIKSKKLVFATGFGMVRNPFFNYLPLKGNKGEYLEIHCPGLQEDRVIKAGVFLIPSGGGQYSVGATYSRKDLSPGPTTEARKYLEEKLMKMINCHYTVIGQRAGIRPTVPDRRPLVGRHPKHEVLYVLNGFGSRGVMLAPYAASQLFHFIEEGEPLDPEIDISRYRAHYPQGRVGQHPGRNG